MLSRILNRYTESLRLHSFRNPWKHDICRHLDPDHGVGPVIHGAERDELLILHGADGVFDLALSTGKPE